MKKYQISCPLVIKHLPSHERYKDQLISLIEQSPGGGIDSGNGNGIDKIISTDYFLFNSKRLYEPLFFTMIQPIVGELIGEIVDIKNTEFKGIQSSSSWYQRYSKSDTHSWHDHAYNSTLSLIYYLELPKGTPGTEFLDPFSGCVHSPKVKEGDVLMFPSFVGHRSPENKSDQIKTIISMNLI